MYFLVDGDGLIYRCGFAVEKTKYLVTPNNTKELDDKFFDTHKEVKEYLNSIPEERWIWSRKDLEPVENALSLVRGAISAFPDGLGEDNTCEIWLSPSVGNFRDQIATYAKYKGNRDYVKRPTYHKEITEYLINQHDAVYTKGQEADDILGIRATEIGEGACIVSFDKDLDQIPGLHYNWVTKEMYRISPKEASLNFYRQALSGDPTDNIPGCGGIGPAKAAKVIEGAQNPREAWIACLAAYTEVYGPEEGERRALETARLVYVRRKEGELWTPPTGSD